MIVENFVEDSLWSYIENLQPYSDSQKYRIKFVIPDTSRK